MSSPGAHAVLSVRRIVFSLLTLAIAFSPRIPLGIAIPGRRFDLRVEDVVLAVLSGVWLLRLMKAPRLTVTPIGRPVGVYILAMTLSTVLGVVMLEVPVLRASLYFLKELEYFFMFLFVANWVKSERDIKAVINGMLFAGIVSVAWFAVQYAEGIYRPLVLFASPEGVYEPQTLLQSYGPGLVGEVSPLSTAGFFMITSLLAANSLMLRHAWWKRMGLRVLTIALIAALLLTQSRVAIVAWFAGATGLVVTRKRAAYVLFGVGVFALAVGLAHLTANPYRPLIWATYKDSLSFRVHNIWLPIWSHVFDRFPLGFGKGALGYLPDIASEEAHNQYLRMVIESGVLGFLAFAWLLVRILLLSWEIGRRGRSTVGRVVGLTVFAVTTGLVVGGTVQDVFVPVVVNELWWFLVGLAVAARRLDGLVGRAMSVA